MSLPADLSLRHRLPLLILTVLASIGLAYTWVAYREVERALRVQGHDRIHTAATNLADLLGQSAATRVADTRRLASDAAVQRFVHAGEDADAAGRAVGAYLARNQLAVVSLFDPGGTLLGRMDRTSTGIGLPEGDAGPEKGNDGTVSALRLQAETVSYSTTAAVRPLSRDSGAAPGFLVSERSLGSPGAVELIERLIGAGALLKVGNATGDIWTDLAGPVDAPPDGIPADAAVRYVDSGGVARLGKAVAVPGTPWLVWVDFEEASLLSPARTLLNRMLPVTLVLIALGAMAVHAVSGRITRPIEELADAADAVAAGDYSRRVPVGRRDEIGRLGTAFNVMAERVAESRDALERRVQARTVELEHTREVLEQQATALANANRELESFSYSVSHDLRAPLRSIDGFAQALVEDYAERLDDTGREFLSRIRAAAQRMGALIDDLLALSRVTRVELISTEIDLSGIARDIAARLQEEAPARRVEWRIQEDLRAEGDPRLLRVALENLLDNAWKFTSRNDAAVIELKTAPLPAGGGRAFVVCDNGAGFDMQYAGKLFGAFQRLHGATEFPGTGIGLATVQRVVRRHGGRIWADAAPGEGAAFWFTLGSEVPS